MALARDVADHLEAVGHAHLGDLAQRRVRLLRGCRVNARANPTLLRALLQRRHLLARLLRHPRMADQLIDRRHALPSPLGTSVRRRYAENPRQNNERAIRFICGRALIRSQRIATRNEPRSCTRSSDTRLSEAAFEFR